jgi:hypothetical protein
MEGHGRSQRIGGQEDDLLSQCSVKYLPHRPHHPQCEDLQVFLAVGI